MTTKIPVELSSTPGIVDGSNATAITIDSSENVGIGISPSNTFSVGASGTVTTRYTSTDTSAFSLLQFENSGSIVLSADHGNSAANSNIIFKSDGATERMRIDSSGNLLVGKTSNTISAAGAKLGTGGSNFTRDNSEVVYVNRTTSDGSLITLAKDGSTVGSIGTQGGDLNIGTAACGIAFVDGVPAVYPWTTSGNATRDAAIDLGDSGGRFKDLYLSGGAYIGGTGSANKLDDYEEGTWTPAYNNGGSIAYTTQEGRYTKIGRLVHLVCKIDVDTVSGTNSSAMQISGAPFTNDGVDETGGSVGINLSGWLNSEGTDMIQINATNASILPSKDTTNDIFRGTDIGTGFVCWSITYTTDS